MEGRLCHLEEDQPTDAIGGDLAGDLAPDTAGSTGHHDDLTLVEPADCSLILMDGVTEEEVLDPDLADALQCDRVAARLGDGR